MTQRYRNYFTDSLIAALRYLINLLLPKKRSWLVVVWVYVSWHTCNYLFGSHTEAYYLFYFLNERIFAVLVFWALSGIVENKLKWVTKSLTWVAIFKLVYAAAVLKNIMPENKVVSWGGSIFVLALVIIIMKWEKRLN